MQTSTSSSGVLIVRVTEEEEYDGVELREFGLHAYPEFFERQGV
jgi:hypothetical protein